MCSPWEQFSQQSGMKINFILPEPETGFDVIPLKAIIFLNVLNWGNRMHRVLQLRFFIVAVTLAVMAASFSKFSFAAGDDGETILLMRFSGTNNDPGWLFKLDTSAGYRFNRHFEITAGLPVYFVQLPDDTSGDGFDSKAGIGNVYVDFRIMAESSGFYFSSSLRGAAPTGNKEYGFSTGRVTVDWHNYFEYSAGMWTPFGSAGIANSISDTHFFTRPFSSFGIVGQFEGGLWFDPAWWIGFGGSAYAVVPSGEQEIYSRVIQSEEPLTEEGVPEYRRRRIHETVSYTIVEAESARDHGYSAWVDFYPILDVALEFGYSRSVFYEYNTLFFSAQFDLAGMILGDHN